MTEEPILSIDIGGTKTIVAVSTDDGRVIAPLRTDRPEGQDAFWILGSLFDRIDRLKSEEPVLFGEIKKCGIGFGGPVRDNRAIKSMHVAGWEEIDLCSEIASRYGVSACMDNDCIVQALGEHFFGAGKGRPSLIFGNLGTGFGGGIVEDGFARRGDGGFAGHFGHVCVVPDGRLCPCGNRGCLEAYCSGSGIGQSAREGADSGKVEAGPLRERIAQLSPVEGAGPVLFELAESGDSFSRLIVEETLDLLSLALSAGVNILDIRLVVLGGGAGLGLRPWLPRLREKMDEKLMPFCREGFEIKTAELGEHSLLLGTVPLCRELLT